jgi:5-methylcytosine-specific restriction endonuclease McrA
MSELQRDPRNSRRWRTLSKAILKEDDLCWICGHGGADTVDHLIPVSVEPALAYEMTNLRPAHRGCNTKRSNKSRGRFFERTRDTSPPSKKPSPHAIKPRRSLFQKPGESL